MHKIIVAVMLSCNVIGIAMGMYARNAGLMDYVNLVGCVIFGAYMALILARLPK